jgi:hypothetical protein
MVAEAGDLNAVLLGSLEDGEVVIDLVGLVVDKDLDLLGGEERQRVVHLPQLAQHHQFIFINPQNNINNIADGDRQGLSLGGLENG